MLRLQSLGKGNLKALFVFYRRRTAATRKSVKLDMKKTLFLFAIFFILGLATMSFGQISVGATLFEGGMRAYQEGRYGEAERLFRIVVTELERAEAKEPDPLLPGLMSDTLNALAGALHGQGKYSEAEKTLIKVIEILGKSKIPADADFSQTSAALNNLGLILAEQKKFKEAEETHRKAIEIREKYDGPPKRNLAVSLCNLGKVYYDQERYEQAEPFFRKSQDIFLAIYASEATGEDIDTMLMNSNNLALIAVRRKDYKEAEKRYLVVIGITEAKKGKNHPDLVAYLNNYAELLRLTKRPVLAKKIEARATRIANQK